MVKFLFHLFSLFSLSHSSFSFSWNLPGPLCSQHVKTFFFLVYSQIRTLHKRKKTRKNTEKPRKEKSVQCWWSICSVFGQFRRFYNMSPPSGFCNLIEVLLCKVTSTVNQNDSSKLIFVNRKLVLNRNNLIRF